jgi:hypothetical protein
MEALNLGLSQRKCCTCKTIRHHTGHGKRDDTASCSDKFRDVIGLTTALSATEGGSRLARRLSAICLLSNSMTVSGERDGPPAPSVQCALGGLLAPVWQLSLSASQHTERPKVHTHFNAGYLPTLS